MSSLSDRDLGRRGKSRADTRDHTHARQAGPRRPSAGTRHDRRAVQRRGRPLRSVVPGRGLGRDGESGRLRSRDEAHDRGALLQLDPRQRRCPGAGPGAGRRGTGRPHAVHGDRRRAGIGHPDGNAVPHPVHDLPGRNDRRDARSGPGDRQRPPRKARSAGDREARRHPRRVRPGRSSRPPKEFEPKVAGCRQCAADRTRAGRSAAVPRDRRGRPESATGRRHWSSSASAPPSRVRPTCWRTLCRRRRAAAGTRHRDDWRVH